MYTRYYFTRRQYFLGKLRGSRRSLTMKFNALMASLIPVIPYAKDALPELKGYVPENVYMYMLGILIAGNVLIRFFKTNSDLADK